MSLCDEKIVVLSSPPKKTTTYDIGNPGPDLRHAHKKGWVNPVN
jgi:hypothetical protein